MTVSIPLPSMRRIEPDLLPQPFRMIDELLCEIVLRAMTEIRAREDKHSQQMALQPREVRMSSLALEHLNSILASFIFLCLSLSDP